MKDRGLVAKQTLIRKIKEYVLLSHELQQQLIDCIAVRHVPENRNLALYEDDHFFVVEGLLKEENSENQRIAHFFAEDGFGIYPARYSTQDFVALEPSLLLVAHQTDIDDLLFKSRELLAAYRRLLITWGMRQNWQAKLLSLSATERKRQVIHRLGRLTNRIPNKDLASYAAINVSYYSTIQTSVSPKE